MPKRTISEPGGDDLQALIINKLSKEKGLEGIVKRASGSLIADTAYYISTQCAKLDFAIGRPGIPAGKVTTIFGREGSGKSTIVQHLLAEIQRMNGIGVLADTEQRFDKEHASGIGCDPDQLIMIEGATIEQVFDSIHKIVDTTRHENADVPVCIVLDSLAGAVGEKRLNAEVGDIQVSSMARFMSEELKKLKLKIAKAGVALVIVNQLRTRVTMMSGDPRSMANRERMKVMGREMSMLAEMPLIFESALMLYINSVATIGEDKEAPTGIRSRAIVRKCGISPHEAWRAEFDIDYLTGINKVGAKFELLEDLEIFKHTSGGWYMWEDTAVFGEKKFQRKDFEGYLANFPQLDDMIRAAPTLWQVGDEGERPSSE